MFYMVYWIKIETGVLIGYFMWFLISNNIYLGNTFLPNLYFIAITIATIRFIMFTISISMKIYTITFYVQIFDSGNYLPAHVPTVCQWTCEDYSTCVYYQTQNGRCYLCIRNTDGISDDQLVEQNDDVIALAYIKVGHMFTYQS